MELNSAPLMMRTLNARCRHWVSLHLKRKHIRRSTTHNPISQRRGSSSIDSYSLLRLLKANTNTSRGTEGMQIHTLVVKLGFESVVFLQTALMGSYSARKNLNHARRLFDEITDRTLFCWSAMMSAYISNRRPDKALELFREMQMESIEPDQVTITIAISACADLGALDIGSWIHAHIARRRDRKPGLEEDPILTNALINMYAKCGAIAAARQLFELASQRDVKTWTSMITGHAVHGQAQAALNLFEDMKNCHGVTPNSVTFIGVLTACSHGGLVEEGKQYWETMERDHGVIPEMGHYGCMVDLLCRAGLLDEAYAFVEGMPVRPSAVIWRTVLSACSKLGEVDLGARARHQLLELEPSYPGDDVAMSNAYAAAGQWDAKQRARRRMMKPRRRDPGCSLIEVGSRVLEFSAADRRHREKRGKIRDVLEGMAYNSRTLVFALGSSEFDFDAEII